MYIERGIRMKNHFPHNLKFLRKKADLTQEALADKMNKDYSTIGKWELGQRNPIMADMVRLSDIFNIPMQDLVEKDLRLENDNKLDETDILYNKYKDYLSEKDKLIIKTIIEETKRDIDKEKGEL